MTLHLEFEYEIVAPDSLFLIRLATTKYWLVLYSGNQTVQAYLGLATMQYARCVRRMLYSYLNPVDAGAAHFELTVAESIH